MSATDWELDGYEALVSELRANPPVAPERLRQQILAGAPGSRRTSKQRRLVFVVVPVAVVLAVGAAFVHGFVSSGSKQRAGSPAIAQALSPAPTTKAHEKATAGPTTTVASGAVLQSDQTAGKTFRSLVIPKNRLVHAAATLQVQVPNHSALTQATNDATKIVSSLGGYAQSVQYESFHGSGNAFLALRVPVGKAEMAIGRLGQLGTLVSQQLSTQDLQQQLTRQTNGIGALRRAIAVYEEALKKPLSASERVAIQIKLANAQHALKQLRKARSGTVASGATADISLTLTTHHGGGAAGGHDGSGRIGRLLGSAANFLALEGIILLYALIVVGPLLLVGGLAWWIVRERRRREESRLLASA
jgi:hypothetical protein